ncbi:MAG: 50S ribosomal protein L32 [Rickettsiales bacterium]|jgi:large subunit ribosomal protein L32|nr:50S ribosomal protein L32 [Rickettsiales bacterium]
MAVPKKKTSPSKRGMRRGGNGTYRIEVPNVVTNSETGEYQLQHHISLDGHYRGRKVIEDKPRKKKDDETGE